VFLVRSDANQFPVRGWMRSARIGTPGFIEWTLFQMGRYVDAFRQSGIELFLSKLLVSGSRYPKNWFEWKLATLAGLFVIMLRAAQGGSSPRAARQRICFTLRVY
jgi:hypothetical protein